MNTTFDKTLITGMCYKGISSTDPRYFNNYHRIVNQVFNLYGIANPISNSRSDEQSALIAVVFECANVALKSRSAEPDFDDLVAKSEKSLNAQREAEANYYAKHVTKGEF